MRDVRFWKLVLIINGLVPLALLIWDALHGQLGANAVNIAIHTTGIVTLVFLFLTLSVTPIRLLTGWNWLIGYRRSLGLFGAFYALVHVTIFFVFDRAMSITSTIHEILTRRYLQVGITAVLLLIPLAVTSTNAMVRRLGARRWKRLHRLAYVIAALGTLHYYMQVKADVRQPLVFAAVLGVLLSSRFVFHYADLRRIARRASVPTPLVATRKFWSGQLRLARLFDETPDVRTFRLVSPDGGPLPFDHQPGQYLNLQLNVDGQRVNRSYTIASPSTRNGYCELTIKREEHGVASTHLHNNVHEGDHLKISAPAGRFVFTGSEADGVALIAGGVGITPLMSIVRSLTDQGWPGRIDLLFIVKTEDDIIFRDELSLLQKRFQNLHVNISLTRVGPEDKWAGQRGRLTREWLTSCVPDVTSKPVYICGPGEMMSATREILMSLDVPESTIKIEAFLSPGVALQMGGQMLTADSPDEAPGTNESMTMDEMLAEADLAPATATFAHSGKTAQMAAGMTVLEASESIGIGLPFECRSGICGQCKVRLLEGSVSMDVQQALNSAEKKAGWVLGCQARPRTDVTLDA